MNKWKKVAATVAATGAIAGTVAVTAPSAQAASLQHCATRADYRKVHNGQTIRKVRRELHSRGHVYGEAGYPFAYKLMHFRACGSSWNEIDIDFQSGGANWTAYGRLRVSSKSAFWG